MERSKPLDFADVIYGLTHTKTHIAVNWVIPKGGFHTIALGHIVEHVSWTRLMPLATFPTALPTIRFEDPASCDAFCSEYADSRPLSLQGVK